MKNQRTYLKTTDFLVTNENFELLYNDNLDMLITHPQPIDLDKYYDTKAYISHHDNTKSLIDKIYRFVKYYTLNRKLDLIEKYCHGTKTLLDIGSGTGDFLVKAQAHLWTSTGIEPNLTAKSKAESKGLSILNQLDQLSNVKFEIITLWHVLEHLSNLEQQIELISHHLNTNGTLIVAVPNFKSYDARYYKTHWAAYDTPRHLWHFSQGAIQKLFQKHGLYVINTLPMYFDSFYVSLLSEKNKTGKSNYIKAFYRGLKSNIKARTTGEYSSLIYILQKQKN